MNEEEIRKKYQREDENDLRGTNVGAMDRFIEMLRLHEKSENSIIRSIAENFAYIGELAPNFTIFQAKDCLFMRNFKAYQISEDVDMIVATHEFGHAVLSIMNHTVVPENYGEVIARAKQHAISPENKEDFKAYIQYISGKTDKKENRTNAEKGPLSDIISSIFQFQALSIGTKENVCILPSSHSRDYYYDEEKGEPNLKNIFDEDFANYYSLKVNNCTQEIETIRRLFGDEIIKVLDMELEKIYERLTTVKENAAQEQSKDTMEQIKGIVISSRKSEIESVNSLEKINEIESENSETKEGKVK